MKEDFYIAKLKAEYQVRKGRNPMYSLRAYARALDIDVGQLSKVFQRKADISMKFAIQALLDEHRTRLRFLLSGSSARKLRRGQANLLPGRIHSYQLGPIVSAELDYQMPTERILSLGSLPGILTDLEEGSAQKTLRTYGATYLKEEIQAEALSRNIEGFARFLKVVTSWSSELVDFSKVASLAGISRQTATRYFEILEDTLIFHRIEPFAKSARIRLVQHPKYYIFDVGVLNGLLGNFICSDDRIERLFETLGLQMTCLTIHLNSRPSPI